MSRAWRDFVGHHLDHHLRLEPHIGHQDRIHARRPLLDLELVRALVDLPPFGVGQAGTELRDGSKPIVFGVVDTREQRAHAERRSLALSEVITEQDQVDGIAELTTCVALQLDPVEVARTGLVFGVRSLDHDALEALADVVEQGLGEDLHRVGLDDGGGEQHG